MLCHLEEEIEIPSEEVDQMSKPPERKLWVFVLNLTLRDCQKIHDEMKLWMKIIDEKPDKELEEKAYKRIAKLQYMKTKIRRELRGNGIIEALDFLSWDYDAFYNFAEDVLMGTKRVPPELFH